MRKYNLIILTVFLTIFIYSTSAFALSNAFILDSAELSSPAFTRSGFSFLLPPSATSHVPSAGTGSSAGFSRNMIARVRSGAGIATVGLLGVAAYAAWVESHPTDYPLSYALLHPGSTPVCTVPAVGCVVSSPYGMRKITSISKTSTQSTTLLYDSYSSAQWLHYIAKDPPYVNPYYYYEYWLITYTFYSLPPPVTLEDFAEALAPDGFLSPTTLPELDRYIVSNPDSIVLPSDLSDLISSASTDLDNDEDLDGIPNADDPDYEDPEEPEDPDDPEDPDIVDPDDPGEIPPPEPPGYDSVSFQPLFDIGDNLSAKFPFSLLSTLKSFASGLIATPRAPHFIIDFPAPLSVHWDVSLDRFDPIAQMVRTLIMMIFLAYVTMALIRRFH